MARGRNRRNNNDNAAFLFLILCIIFFIGSENNSPVEAQRPDNSRPRVNKVELSGIDAITLVEGEMSTARSTAPVPQLKCIGGSAKCHHKYRPKVVRCLNRGTDGRDVQWDCKAELDNKVRFGRLNVNCEGWEHPDDPYVVQGSCGLQYELDMKPSETPRYDYNDDSSGAFGVVFIIVIVAIVLLCVLSQKNAGSPAYDGLDTPSAPPPSYAQAQRTNYGFVHDTATSSDGPGFWSGLGLGGLGGYFAGRASSNPGYENTYTYRRRRSPSPVSRSDSNSGTSTQTGYATTSRR